MSDFYEHLEAAWNDLSKEDKEKFISSNIRQQQRHYKQQPIPQDINIAGEWLHDFFSEHSTIIGMGESKMSMEKWQEAANGVAQLLLPELQQLREGNGAMERQAIRDLETIEQQKSQIDELKRNVFGILAERESLKLDNKRQAVEIESLKIALSETKALNNAYAEKIERQNKRIESLEQEIDGEEAISRDRNLALQQSLDEIESLKQENLRIKEDFNSMFQLALKKCSKEEIQSAVKWFKEQFS